MFTWLFPILILLFNYIIIYYYHYYHYISVYHSVSTKESPGNITSEAREKTAAEFFSLAQKKRTVEKKSNFIFGVKTEIVFTAEENFCQSSCKINKLTIFDASLFF